MAGDDVAGDREWTSPLQDVSFPDLLTRIGAAGISGCLTVTAPETRRRLDFAAGRLIAVDGAEVAAADDDDWVADTVLELCALTEGTYLFQEGPVDPPPDGGMPPSDVLTRTDRRLAAWRDVTTYVPSTLAVPRLVPHIATSFEVDAASWPVLAVVDGRRTVADIMGVLNRRAFDVCETLARFVRLGAVAVDFNP